MLLRDATREFPPIFVALAGTLKVPLRHADPRVVNDDEPQCPTCRIDLAPTMYETAIVWACPVCTGTFMPRDQLYAITANMTHPRSDAERLDALDRASDQLPLLDVIRESVSCPWCRREMVRSVFDGRSGIGIDECKQCGVWLDPGELPRTEAWREALRLGLRPRSGSDR